MYKLGIIGGMGPLATVRFYERLILNTKAKTDNEHLDLVILNHAGMPDRTRCILEGEEERFLHAIKNDFEILNRIGVKLIAIPCNTSHYFFDYYKNFTSIPIINMVESSVLEVKKRGHKKICVFSTTGTAKSGIYKSYANKHGLDFVELNEEDQSLLMDIIYGIKESNVLSDAPRFNELIGRYCSEDRFGIVACTELSLLEIDKNHRERIIDAMDILVEESLRLSGKHI